ncbi:MAG TPA: D-glycero-beta-D-manno-heptose-7-phosphate kinase [Candidatus Binatia bacterium]
MASKANRLLALLAKFRRSRVLVVGDLMLDRFIWGEVERISPEAPVPVLRMTMESFRLGGAANVVNNIHSLGGRVSVAGVIGHDRSGSMLLQELREAGISTTGIFQENGLQTTQKIRVIAHPRHQQIVRLDRENGDQLGRTVRLKIRQFVQRNLGRCDAVVISDYGKGVIHRELLDIIGRRAKESDLFCVVDPKKENFTAYRNVSLVTPNREEASQAAGIEIRDDATLREAGRRLIELWQAKAVLITRGSEGMSLFRPGREVRHFPAEQQEIFDVTGAGDTVVAAVALALASGSSYEEAAVVANLAASLVGSEVGPVAVPAEKLKRAVRGQK